jgi:RNA polymerase sigma factor (sigma-70 family)
MTAMPGADSPLLLSESEEDLLVLIRGLPAPQAADALARRLLPWVRQEIKGLRRTRNFPRAELDDAVQEITWTLLRSLPDFDPNLPARLRTFLGAVVRRRFSNYCRDFRRRHRREPATADVTELDRREPLCRLQDSSWRCQDPAELACLHEAHGRLRRLEQQLDETEQLLLARNVFGITLAEMARRLGLHIATVKRRQKALWDKVRHSLGTA